MDKKRISKDRKVKNLRQKTQVYLSEEQIDTLVHINKENLSKMSISEKFRYLLPRVMVKVCYEIAVIPCEIVHLCIEDIDVPRHSGLVPITVASRKDRPFKYYKKPSSRLCGKKQEREEDVRTIIFWS